MTNYSVFIQVHCTVCGGESLLCGRKCLILIFNLVKTINSQLNLNSKNNTMILCLDKQHFLKEKEDFHIGFYLIFPTYELATILSTFSSYMFRFN